VGRGGGLVLLGEAVGDRHDETAEHERRDGGCECGRRQHGDQPPGTGDRGGGTVVLVGQRVALSAAQQVAVDRVGGDEGGG
jgi:hypothetical protein